MMDQDLTSNGLILLDALSKKKRVAIRMTTRKMITKKKINHPIMRASAVD
jgi:hypothetical protein